MLPEFFDIKRQLYEKINSRVTNLSSTFFPLLAKIPKSLIFEGHRYIIVDEQGRQEEMPMKDFSVDITIDPSTVSERTISDIVKDADEVAKEMASKQEGLVIETLEKAIISAGNVINKQGTPFEVEDLFSYLENRDFDLDQNNELDLSSIGFYAPNPKIRESISKAMDMLKNDPTHRKRLKEILSKKLEEARAGEINRQLVG